MKNAFPIDIIPANDAQRVAALQRYGIFGAQRQPCFDNIATLASTIFDVPIAHISFLDSEHEFILSETGLGEMGLVARGESLCALTVLEPKVLVIEDALNEPLLEKHPAVHGDFALRFYAGAPIITPEGHIIGTMCLVDKHPRTLTQKETEILTHLATVAMEQVELRRANLEQTEHLNFMISQKDEFIGIASHELKTPITSLKAYLQLLERASAELTGTHIPSLLQKATGSLNKLSNLVTDMLTANRLSSGKLTPELSAFDIRNAIENTCNSLKESGQASIRITGAKNLNVYADPNHIAQTLNSLIDNAQKYASGPEKIKVHLSSTDTHATISVSDNGPGIPKERLPQLFERYNSSYNAKMQLSGLGLGLYLSADIIKSNGGQIGVKSELGKGTTFWFTLPLA